MGYQLFNEIGSHTREFISITDNKTFGLPRTFLNSHKITGKHKAVIFYDSETNKVALHFTLTDPKFGLAVRVPNDKFGGIVAAKSFFDVKGIDPKKYSQRYDFNILPLRSIGIDKDGNIYEIELKEKQKEQPRHKDTTIEGIDDNPIDLSEIPF